MEEYLKRIEQLEKENEDLRCQNARLEEKLNAALDNNGLCLWEQHIPSGTLTIFNMQWGKMLGYQPHELTATVETWKNNLHPEDYDLAVGAFEDHLAGKTDLYQVVHRMMHKDGTDSWVSDRGRIVEYADDGSPLRMMGTHIDITNEKRYEQQLAKLANSDPLTGLLNRSAMEKCFKENADLCQSIKRSLIFFDVDNFKTVNDELGHHAGDSVLISIANSLKELTPTDAQIARIGGDEFVILCKESSRKELGELCDRLLTCVPSTMQSIINLDYENALNVGLSIGVCIFQASKGNFEEIYQKADAAMYEIKKNGKNGVAFIELT
ncbi:diguanylate cyclase [Vibrio natriegens]|uniref:sensor domain-containing diguanylate cyclase n=1 Tax=Vibrio natriegens TaxID=691 RepID=UPI000804404A|nr:sensor domain-containing diguanylate cyclase [Vibrio natriegens]ANQ24163.1 diguanylate cyclase [Vibrio natriegens]